MQQTSFTDKNGKIDTTNGKTKALSLNDRTVANVQFNRLNLDTVPKFFRPGNLVSASLRLYLPKVKNPAPISIHAVTSAWTEGNGDAAISDGFVAF